MKKIVYITILILIFLVSCNKKTTKKQERADLINISIDVEKGQWVMCPAKYLIDSAFSKGIENSVFVYYPRKVIDFNENSIFVAELGDTSIIPKYFVIPLPKNENVSKGDIVLSWWQKGTGMQRALVFDVVQDGRPVVYYLDGHFSFSQSNLKYLLDTLKKDTYINISEKALIGRSFMINEEYISSYYITVAENKDSVMGLSWAGIIKVFKKTDCNFVPLNIQLKEGDSVLVPYLGTYCDGIIKKMWNDIGKVDVLINFLGDSLTTKVVKIDIFKK